MKTVSPHTPTPTPTPPTNAPAPTPARVLRLLAATAVMTLAGAVMQTAQAAPGGHGAMAQMGGRGTGQDGPAHMGRLLDRVGASTEQKAQIKSLMESARSDMKPLRAQIKTLRERGTVLFTQPAVDANAVEALRLQLQGLHDQVSKRMVQAMVESSRVLTPDQRTKMAELMNTHRAMRERHRAEAEALMGTPAGAK